MASVGTHPHRMDLGRIVVEGTRQPVVHAATLTLKDQDDRCLMQVHVDGETLAQWDLALLADGDLAFYSVADQKMLQFTLPSVPDGRTLHAKILKTLQLFLNRHQDFHTAVGILSRILRHVEIKKLLPRPLDMIQPPSQSLQPSMRRPVSTSALPAMPFQIQYSGSGSTLTRSPLPASLARRPTPKRSSSGMFVQDAVQRDASQPPTRRPLSAIASYGAIQPQRYRYPPSCVTFLGGLNQARRITRHSSIEASVGTSRQAYSQDLMHRPPPGDRGPSTRQILEETVYADESRYEVPDGMGQIHDSLSHQNQNQRAGTSHADHPSSSRLNHFYQRHSPLSMSQPETAKGASSVSESGVPIRIQFIQLESVVKTPWEFSLHLMPCTKIWELCLFAASHIRRHLHLNVDGRGLEARGIDGHAFDWDSSIPEEVLDGATVFLTEQRPSNVGCPVTYNPHASMSEGSQEHSNINLRQALMRDIDENQVPPPRKLPFRTTETGIFANRPNSAMADRPRVSETLDLPHTKTRTVEEEPVEESGKPAAKESTTKGAGRKHPATRPSRPRSALRKSPSTSRTGLHGLSQSPRPPKLAGSPGVTTRAAAALAQSQQNGDATLDDASARGHDAAGIPCMGCRNRKRRCDMSKPSCSHCAKDGRKCIYPNTCKPVAATIDSRTGSAANSNDKDQTMTRTFMQDAGTQSCPAFETRDAAVQTKQQGELDKEKRELVMADSGTDPCYDCIHASVETEGVGDIWLPFAHCAEVVGWAKQQHKQLLKKAAEILQTTDSSQDDYVDRVRRAAACGLEFELGLREKWEEILNQTRCSA